MNYTITSDKSYVLQLPLHKKKKKKEKKAKNVKKILNFNVPNLGQIYEQI